MRYSKIGPPYHASTHSLFSCLQDHKIGYKLKIWWVLVQLIPLIITKLFCLRINTFYINRQVISNVLMCFYKLNYVHKAFYTFQFNGWSFAKDFIIGLTPYCSKTCTFKVVRQPNFHKVNYALKSQWGLHFCGFLFTNKYKD